MLGAAIRRPENRGDEVCSACIIVTVVTASVDYDNLWSVVAGSIIAHFAWSLGEKRVVRRG
jgi:hypothetical protein